MGQWSSGNVSVLRVLNDIRVLPILRVVISRPTSQAVLVQMHVSRYMANVQFLQSIRPIFDSANTNISLQIGTTESAAPPKDYRRGCSCYTTGPGEYVMTAGLVASMHDINIAYLPGCRGQSHFEDTAYRFVPLNRQHRFDRKKRVLFGFTVKHRYRKWYSCLSIITHEVRSRDHGFCIDGFMMEVIRGVKVVANLGIN